MIKKELQQELNRTKLVLDYARQEIKEKDKEIERLNNIINELEKRLEQSIEELENIPINANGGDILESERKVYHILKGSDKE